MADLCEDVEVKGPPVVYLRSNSTSNFSRSESRLGGLHHLQEDLYRFGIIAGDGNQLVAVDQASEGLALL